MNKQDIIKHLKEKLEIYESDIIKYSNVLKSIENNTAKYYGYSLDMDTERDIINFESLDEIPKNIDLIKIEGAGEIILI